jgi:hypothetical protein
MRAKTTQLTPSSFSTIKMASVSTLFTSLLILSIIITLLSHPIVADNILYTGERLSGSQSLTYGSYNLTMQRDCNLVLYDNGRAEWSTGTDNRGSGCFVRMQTDGNLVLYDGSERVLWASNTDREQGNYVLILQRDRNVVIYGGAMWASRTSGAGNADVVISRN